MRINIPLVVTVLVLVAGAALFVATDGIGKQQRMSGAIYEQMQLKVNYAPSGEIKLFANAPERYLKAYPAAEGSNTPTGDALVIGSAEAQMMRDEGLINGVGDPLEGFFGISTDVGGILRNTSEPIDDLHFLTAEQYAAIDGEEGRVYVKLLDGMPKLFYRKGLDEQTPLQLRFAEGSAEQYRMQTVEGKEYYPLVIGATEAAMMREEGLFAQPGDRIDGFFGQDVTIVGVLAPTNTSLDMMHVLPLGADGLQS